MHATNNGLTPARGGKSARLIPPFRAGSETTDYRAGMFNFLSYDFGYTWSIRYAMLVPLVLAGGIAGVAVWRSWPRWVSVPMALVALWAAAAVVILNAMLNGPMALPTERFLTSGSGRVLDVGAGSGRAAMGVLLARPNATAVGVDIYSGYWGIDKNTPERFMRNARIAGVGERADARVGDMRELPFGDGEFDAGSARTRSITCGERSARRRLPKWRGYSSRAANSC